MTHFKQPTPGKDLSQTEVARALEEDAQAPVVGELDLGLDDDPNLRTRPGQAALRPRRRRPPVLMLVAVCVVGAAGAWLFGLFEGLGVPAPPAALSKLFGGVVSEAPTAIPERPREEPKQTRKTRRR